MSSSNTDKPSPVLTWVQSALAALELARIEIVTGKDCGGSLDQAATMVKEARAAREFYMERK